MASPLLVLFARGILARLDLWPALRIAVQHAWGGPSSSQKKTWLAGVLVDQFESSILPSPPTLGTTTSSSSSSSSTSPPPDAHYIEELLLQIMADEFDVVIEDDSAASVARDIVAIWHSVSSSAHTDERGILSPSRNALVEQWEARANVLRGRAVVAQEGEGEGSDSSWEDDDDDDGEPGSGGGDSEIVPRLLDHTRDRPREPEVDDDGFVKVHRKGFR